MQTYLVGGAVRDQLLGREVKDRDFVVVGSSAAEMLSLGFEQVGAGFPVFLHPVTREEYALARREKKVGAGYGGFEFETTSDVTLAEDLSRRDLTINSMALAEDGTIIDPHGGQADLENRVLRHTSEAFAEDPLRVIRLARFFARYDDFTIAVETRALARAMVGRGQLDELPAERFFLEIEKALSDTDPVDFMILLAGFGVFNDVRFFRETFGFGNTSVSDNQLLEALKQVPQADRLDIFMGMAAKSKHSKFPTSRSEKLFRAVEQWKLLRGRTDGVRLEPLLTGIRAWGEGGAVDDLLTVVGLFDQAYDSDSLPSLMAAVEAGRSVTSHQFAHLAGKEIGVAMKMARMEAIDKALST